MIVRPKEMTRMISPDVIPFVQQTAPFFGCDSVIDAAGRYPEALAAFGEKLSVYSIHPAEKLPSLSRAASSVTWLAQDDSAHLAPLIVNRAFVTCFDGLDNLADPAPVLVLLRQLMDNAPAGIVTSRRFSPPDLRRLLLSAGLHVEHSGRTVDDETRQTRSTSVALLSNASQPPLRPAPVNFRVIAMLIVYNEEDIIAACLDHLIKDGIEVYLINNWSTDRTVEIARQYLGKGVIHIENFPMGGRGKYSHLAPRLRRKEQLARMLKADWFIHHDVDEIRESPWPGVNLRDGLYRVQQLGYNAVNFTMANFTPVDDSYAAGKDPAVHFRYFDWGHRPAHFQQIKVWRRNTGQPVELEWSGGHEVRFEGRKVFPYRFLLRHYQFRTQAQAQKKVFKERIPLPEEQKRRLWSILYTVIPKDYSFVRPADELIEFTASFYEEYLLERLSAVGIRRDPPILPGGPNPFLTLARPTSGRNLPEAFPSPPDPDRSR